MDPITLLIYLLVFVICIALLFYLMQALGLPSNITLVVLLLCVLIFLLWVLKGGGIV